MTSMSGAQVRGLNETKIQLRPYPVQDRVLPESHAPFPRPAGALVRVAAAASPATPDKFAQVFRKARECDRPAALLLLYHALQEQQSVAVPQAFAPVPGA